MTLLSQITALAAAISLQTPADTAQARFDAFATAFPALNTTVMVEGEIVWEAEGGFAQTPIDGTATDYNFYSIAKLFTAMAYARLVETQGLDLDRPVRTIDPALPAHYDAVTLRHLLNHRAGVRHYRGEADWREFGERRCATPADALGHFIADPLVSVPGEDQQYTTFGYVLLSHLLVQLTGEADFDAAMTAVLGEHYRAVSDHEGADKAANMFGQPDALVTLEGLSAECKFGGGGLLASARELADMGQALAAGEIVSLEALPGLIQEENGVFGIAAGHDTDVDMHYAAHSGGSPGGRAFLIVLVEPQVVVAVTANYDGPNHGQFAIGLSNLFAGIESD